MPSFTHEILVELFRRRPELARELLASCAGIAPIGGVAELGSTDLSQIAPAEYRADVVIVARDDERAPLGATIVEVQLQVDPDKRRTWPLYVSALRAGLDCPVILLVLVRDEPVARWARQPIELGHPGFCLCPVVVAYDQVPRITDLAAARASPELAVLSTLAHPEIETANAAAAAIRSLPADPRELYWDVVMAALPDSIRAAMEANMIKGYEYQSEFAKRYFAQGREEGREATLRVTLRKQLELRFGPLDRDLAARIEVARPDALERCLERVVNAESAAAVFEE